MGGTLISTQFELLDVKQDMGRLPSEFYDLGVSIFFGVVKRCSLENIDSFIGLITRCNQELKNLKKTIFAGIVHRILQIVILCSYVGIILY